MKGLLFAIIFVCVPGLAAIDLGLVDGAVFDVNPRRCSITFARGEDADSLVLTFGVSHVLMYYSDNKCEVSVEDKNPTYPSGISFFNCNGKSEYYKCNLQSGLCANEKGNTDLILLRKGKSVIFDNFEYRLTSFRGTNNFGFCY